ncbi:thiamine phosphate synthase [Seonamhaeicola sp. S2-3]|uniref:thiamine phosphate synthase n=1 Tax=Seonamhaeicola sp. S2-3 TaxID=1936081 RepID=UPI0009727C92|nr:thiamine phosphate synthase [Seonamhaeicola sp. S2-3]APY12767.1 thiamine phosphate synthase [Seonamhaeicola sp. S2-3]
MIVLIAPEYNVTNEIDILQQLFKNGLQYFHLRKPYMNYEQHCDYLNQIDSKYHNYIVTHRFHELLKNYNLKGIHFQEAKRRQVLNTMPSSINKKQFIAQYAKLLNVTCGFLETKTISSSFHEPDELENCSVIFNYHLLSPVFSSISKQGYSGRGFNVNNINKKVIGMGGVTASNLAEFYKLGFKGVGVLGGIWQSNTPVEVFKTMKCHFN